MARQTALPPTLRPRLVDREAAAAYISASPTTFDSLVDSGHMPKPRLLPGTRRKAWDVVQLDRAVDALPCLGGDDPPEAKEIVL